MAVLANLNGKFVNPLLVEFIEDNILTVTGMTNEAVPREVTTETPVILVHLYSGETLQFEATHKDVELVKVQIADKLSLAMNTVMREE